MKRCNFSNNVTNQVTFTPSPFSDKKTNVSDGVVVHCLDIDSSTQDKYNLALRFKSKHEVKMDKAESTHIFKLWDRQSAGRLGDIPITDQTLPNNSQAVNTVLDLLQTHEKNRNYWQLQLYGGPNKHSTSVKH